MGRFELVLFSTDEEFIRGAVQAGVDTVIVDWETRGKETRQTGWDTEINHGTLDDLKRVRKATQGQVLCRLNGYGPTTESEVEQAVEAGADELLLPMVRSVGEVAETLGMVNGRCGLGILVETMAAVAQAPELGGLPLSRVFVGLNDLAVDRCSANLFAAVADGTVERVRDCFDVPFGFGGLTLPDRGFPIPCRLLIGEMARLRCSFSFLRRSFNRDIQARQLAVEIPRLCEALNQATFRPPEVVASDRLELQAAIERVGTRQPKSAHD